LALVNIGIRNDQPENVKSKIRLSNIFASIAFIIFAVSGLHNMTLGDLSSGIHLEILAVMCLLTWIINRFGMQKLSISYLFGLITLAIFYFDSYSGINSGSYLYYFPLLLAIANIFDFRTGRDKIVMFVHLGFIGILVFVNLFTGHTLFQSRLVTAEQQNTMFIINMAFSFVCLGYFIYLVVHTNMQKLNLLENKVREESKMRALEQEKNRDKEILLAELQHRLKNNLSLMSSLLKLKLDNVNDANYPLAFKESIHAIQTVAQANHLQKFEDGKLFVNLRNYLIETNIYWHQLLGDFPISGEIKMNVCDYQLNVKQAIPVGLIFHEAISLFWFHALEHQTSDFLEINVTVKEDIVEILFSSSVENLLSINPAKEVTIHALVDQIDATHTSVDKYSFCIEIPNGKNAPMLESESLFRAEKI